MLSLITQTLIEGDGWKAALNGKTSTESPYVEIVGSIPTAVARMCSLFCSLTARKDGYLVNC